MTTPKLDLAGPVNQPTITWTYAATILEVSDADTFRALVDLGFDASQRMTLRLSGVDAPETRMTLGVTTEEKRQGLYMRDALRERLTGERVLIVTEKDRREKYGRYLAEVWHDGTCVNAWVKEETARWSASLLHPGVSP